MAKKPSRKTLDKKLNALVREIVLKRDKRCVTCGATPQQQIMEAGHLFSRVAHSTKWDLKNIYLQCKSCNSKHETDAHPLMRYAESVHGREAIDALHRKYWDTKPFKTWQMEELYEELLKKVSQS